MELNVTKTNSTKIILVIGYISGFTGLILSAWSAVNYLIYSEWLVVPSRVGLFLCVIAAVLIAKHRVSSKKQ